MEHCIAQHKKFAILGSRYRGHLHTDGEFLRNVMLIICGIVILQTRDSPLRKHDPLLGLDDEDLELVEEKAAELAAREYIAGMPIGSHTDIRRGEDFKLKGPGDEEPPDHGIDSGQTARDFAVGTRFWCFLVLTYF